MKESDHLNGKGWNLMKAIVIGAGVIGSAVAYRLTEAGAKVTLIDENRVGGGTSGISFAWVNSNRKPPRNYHDLNVAGMKTHAGLKEEFGATPWFHRSGGLEWCATQEDEAEHKAKVKRLKDWGYAADFISRKELAELEPDLDIDQVGDAAISYCSEEGWLDPVVYANAMVKQAVRAGATLLIGLKVIDIVTRNAAAIGVRTRDGKVHEGDVVVNCAGRWADQVVEDPHLRIPLAPTVGFLVFTPPVATSVSHVIRSPEIHLRPDGAGRLMMRHGDLDELVTLDTPATPTLAPSGEAMHRAARLISGLKSVSAEAVRITARPIPKDGLSAVGPVPRLANYYLVVTHSGVTLSPYLAQAAADEIVRGKIRTELNDFRPGRFFN
jgi:glycine/D-amino acid oxidase-like deaminating enzyme